MVVQPRPATQGRHTRLTASACASVTAAQTCAGVAVFSSILDAIGRTPLVRLARLGRELAVELYGKVEGCNPGGSAKDRLALHLCDMAERRGLLRAGGTIVEASAGALADSTASPLGAGPAAGSTASPAHPRRYAAGRVPRLTADEAKEEGLVPPKTATMMPAYAMIGVGSLLLGLFLLRQRTGHRRRRY